MTRLLPLTSVTTTSVAFAALRAGPGVANALWFGLFSETCMGFASG
jgi:hypothetical protein